MNQPLTSDEIEQLPKIISAPRFTTYLRANNNIAAGALALYRWNLEISAAFMGPLHMCEIALRNGIADAIAAVHGNGWPQVEGFISSLPNPRNGYNTKLDLQNCARQHQNTGKVVASLKFVFWERLLSKRFDRSIWQPQFRNQFPGAVESGGINSARTTYRDNINNIRQFRNRIAHHEPIFTRCLSDDLERIINVVHWRSPVAAKWIRNTENVSQFLAAKP